MKKFIFLIVAILIAELSNTVASSGVKVVDGDSLEINGGRIRLTGIDAPEYPQTCQDENGKSYPCGIDSKNFLMQMIDREKAKGLKVKCIKEDIDRYNRSLSVCYAGDVNLNYQMVKSGMAVAYKSDRFVKAEKRAKKRKIGLWRGKFMRPEVYRALTREQEKEKNIMK